VIVDIKYSLFECVWYSWTSAAVLNDTCWGHQWLH